MRDLVLGFIPDEWLHGLNYDTLEKLPGSYVTDDFRHRADDVVWRVKVEDSWVYLYILIEFQSNIDPFMAVRMMVYVGLLYKDLIKRDETLPNKHLPPLKNLVATVMRFEHPINDKALIDLIGQLNDWLDGQPELKRTIAIWIRAVLLRQSKNTLVLPKINDLKALKMTLAERFDEWAKAHEQKGLQKGLEKGEVLLLPRLLGAVAVLHG